MSSLPAFKSRPGLPLLTCPSSRLSNIYALFHAALLYCKAFFSRDWIPISLLLSHSTIELSIECIRLRLFSDTVEEINSSAHLCYVFRRGEFVSYIFRFIFAFYSYAIFRSKEVNHGVSLTWSPRQGCYYFSLVTLAVPKPN